MPNPLNFVHSGASTALPPLLICSDLQKGLFFGQNGRTPETSLLRRCEVLLEAWRKKPWPVAHLKRIASPAWFDPNSENAEWIDDFKPCPGELAFEHALPSAYSSARFVEYMRGVLPAKSILVGCSLEETILSTAVEGYHRGYHHQVVADAVVCKSADGTAYYRDTILQLLGTYSARSSVDAVLGIAC